MTEAELISYWRLQDLVFEGLKLASRRVDQLKIAIVLFQIVYEGTCSLVLSKHLKAAPVTV